METIPDIDPLWVGDGQMTDTVPSHDPHRLVDRTVGSDRDRSGNHYFIDPCVLRGSSFKNDLSGVVSFGNQARQVTTIQHEKRSDVLVGHDSECFVNSRFRADRPDLSALLLQYLRNSIKYLHMITVRDDQTSAEESAQGLKYYTPYYGLEDSGYSPLQAVCRKREAVEIRLPNDSVIVQDGCGPCSGPSTARWSSVATA